MQNQKNKNIITITRNAAKKIKSLLKEKGEENYLGIRIGIKSGGCSGLSYFLEYSSHERKFDEVVEDKGIKIIIDKKAILYLLGSKVDYVEEKFKSGFVFTNPNKKSQCGCGKSFNV